jgi:uncharacterized protein
MSKPGHLPAPLRSADPVNMDSTKVCGPVVLSGASGMLGTALQRSLTAGKTQTIQLIRRNPAAQGHVRWDPTSDQPIADPSRLEGIAAAIHLSGASVAGHRWTPAYRREMTASRVDSTRRLATALARLSRPPASLLVASAIGIYGDRGDVVLDESSTPGSGFLADLCRQWEAAAEPAVQAGIRVVHLRFGVVLGRGQGALQQMLPPFRVGLGARLGNGRQWMSWVSLEDAVNAVMFLLERQDLAGVVNVTGPNPVTNSEFTRALGHQLGKPAFLAVPAFAARLIFGQMADEALLASARVKPAKLIDAGFPFSTPEIDGALQAALA